MVKKLCLLALCGMMSTAQAEPISLTAERHAAAPLAFAFQITLSTQAPVELICDEVGGLQERHRLVSPKSQTHALTLFGLKPETRYTCAAATRSRQRVESLPVEIQSEALPSDLVPPRIRTPSALPPRTGYTVFNYAHIAQGLYYDVNYLVVLDPWGNVRWFQEGVGGGDIDISYLGDGKFLYGGRGNVSVPPTVVDLAGQVSAVLQPSAASTWDDPESTNHEAGLTATGTGVLSLTFEEVDEGAWRGFLIRETDLASNKLLWKWSSVENGVAGGYLESGPTQGKYDPFHANAVIDTVEDGRRYIYVGLRNESQILKIDYATKAVVWKLGVGGDFTLLENDGTPTSDPSRWFLLCHDFKRRGNLLSFYDNGVGRDFSRALQLEIDEDTMTARIVFEYTEQGWYEPIWGGYDAHEDGTSLLALAHAWTMSTSVDRSALVELNESGRVLWRAELPTPEYMLYRAERVSPCELFNNLSLCLPPTPRGTLTVVPDGSTQSLAR